MAPNTGKEFITTQMEFSTTAISNTISSRAKEPSPYPTDNTGALSIRARWRAMEFSSGETGRDMTDSTKTTENMAKVNTRLSRVRSTRVVGKTGLVKEKESSLLSSGCRWLGSGVTENIKDNDYDLILRAVNLIKYTNIPMNE